MSFTSPVEQHYHRQNLYETIIDKLKEIGVTAVSRKDIAGVDEFHIRGAAVSIELAREAGFENDCSVVDVGCGLGGPCRLLADEYGCNVTGIDLTEEFIETAKQLTKLLKMDDKVSFLKADALQMPFEDNSFDFAWTQHVQMNIKDKQKFYAEIHRVLKPGGKFIYYDVFSKNGEPLHYPVPWADNDSISFLINTTTLNDLLQGLGFVQQQTKDQTNAGIQFLKELFEKMQKGELPKISLPILIGVSTPGKFQNLYKNFMEDKLELQSGIYIKQ